MEAQRMARACIAVGRRWALRVDGLLTRERLRNYPLIFLCLGAVVLGVSTVQRLLDPAVFGAVLPDYLAHWTGGALLLDGRVGELYDVGAQAGIQERVTGPSSSLSWFVSPPLVAALYAPFALLDYPASAGLWLVLNLALLAACLRSLSIVAPRLMARRGRLVVVVLCASAPVFELLGGGQDAAFVLAVWLLAIRLMTSRHQVMAGAVLGLVLLKPQHAVLVPVVLLVTRRFGALWGFVVTGSVQGAVSLVLLGPAGVLEWVGALTGSDFTGKVQQGQAWKMVSMPALLHGLAPGLMTGAVSSMVALLVLVAAATVLVLMLLRAQRSVVREAITAVDPTAVLMAALCTTVVFSPHLVVYDAVLLFPVALFLLERRPSVAVRLALMAAFITSWLAPALYLGFGQLAWPLSIGAAPWTAVPLLILWVESLRMLTQPAGSLPPTRTPADAPTERSGASPE
jgi:hypothetical protein